MYLSSRLDTLIPNGYELSIADEITLFAPNETNCLKFWDNPKSLESPFRANLVTQSAPAS
jgi:hypothetical protein